MQWHQLVGAEAESGVSSAVVIAEFHFVDPRGVRFDNRAHLPASQAVTWQVLKQCDDGERLERFHDSSQHVTGHKTREVLIPANNPNTSGRLLPPPGLSS